MRPTIKDVAKIAGISVSTVSRVLTNDPHVSEKTLEKVNRAIKEVGYIPNSAARSLVNKKRSLIGLIIPELENPYYTLIINGVEKSATQHGYGIILFCLSNNRFQKSSIGTLVELGVDGIIHAGPLQNDILVPQLQKQKTGLVLLGRKIESLKTNCVLVNDRNSAYNATKHLLNLNHKSIGYIFGKNESFSSCEKSEGYQAALKDAGITIDLNIVRPGYLQFEGGYEAALSLIHCKDRPTAILAGNDMMALGAREAILEAGLRIPEDIALMGIDDIFWTSLNGVEISTMSVPKYKMGYLACELLIKHILDPDAPVEDIWLEAEIRIRKSCGFNK